MFRRTLPIATLLFFSGMCALVYQVAWLRELRLIFGSSTPASSAVLAVFMGGLGYGSLVLGKRVEKSAQPLFLYAHFEIGIALTAAITPLLLHLVRAAYLAVGGTTVLGLAGGTIVRLLLSALVLLPPTLLMGGTLPAAARAATSADDLGRRSTALLYGLNTLGAVVGAACSTFILLEVFGTRLTLWLGCLVNILVALAARAMARSFAAEAQASTAAAAATEAAALTGDGNATPATLAAAITEATDAAPAIEVPPTDAVLATDAARATDAAPAADLPSTGAAAGPSLDEPVALGATSFVLAAAAAAGFVFLLMELVWYRMLSPLLGGSSYTFGLILAVALLGIGLGGLAYTLRDASARPTLLSFAGTCGLEALFMAIPYALGDRIAWLTLSLRSLGSIGLTGHVLGWTVVTAIVVLPAAIVAGYQFPLLIALLGHGKHRLGREVGLAYAANTAGAIVGSLSGGFFLIPLLGALGCWTLTVWVLVVMGAMAIALEFRPASRAAKARPLGAVFPALALGCAAFLLHSSLGPTSFWRHTPIGAGRADQMIIGANRNSMEAAWRDVNRSITWETDGREASVALHQASDTSFVVSGKSDGAAVIDAGTQVMSGLLGAMMHMEPVKRVLVIGLGTGSTAGWLGLIPGVERVDVIELEPAILHVAKVCTPVNGDVMNNPKVHIMLGDAREVLLTSREQYDVIFSEPSNPYRAGIASLFTREFYQAAKARLAPRGVFAQWFQAYEIDALSVLTVYASLASEFGSVESWRTQNADLLLLSREADEPLDVDILRKRITEKPYAEALLNVWRATTLEDVLARYVARPGLARAIAETEGPLRVNTDDVNTLEFSLARALGRPRIFSPEAMLLVAHQRGEGRPIFARNGEATVNWDAVKDGMIDMGLAVDESVRVPPTFEPSAAMKHRIDALTSWRGEQPKAVVSEWEAQDKAPTSPIEVMVLADAYALTGAVDKALPLVERLRTLIPGDADVIEAQIHHDAGRAKESWASLRRALVSFRTNPWPTFSLMQRKVRLATSLALVDPSLYPDVVAVLSEKFVVSRMDFERVGILFDLTMRAKSNDCVRVLESMGTLVPWHGSVLNRRAVCYERAQHPGLEHALEELRAFNADEPYEFGAKLGKP
ncbi:MAG: spermidine synthase [Myxococcales bacterium]|nr:spermidine synthase [Myxococcales bacterium]